MARNRRSAMRQLQRVFGTSEAESREVLRLLERQGFNPRVNTLGERSSWVETGAVFDAIELVEAGEEEDVESLTDEDVADILYPGEYEITFRYEEND